ncbi:hypothetical protein [Methanosarcina sp. UBA5]|uniref:hypothetical protein n=1 Tax=Methanosarcina sp. UBA5 TaxID=1915593 RepID=UPI0025D48AAE|nr:hypothetical protein [Methanosarcina sp. UBA5]
MAISIDFLSYLFFYRCDRVVTDTDYLFDLGTTTSVDIVVKYPVPSDTTLRAYTGTTTSVDTILSVYVNILKEKKEKRG